MYSILVDLLSYVAQPGGHNYFCYLSPTVQAVMSHIEYCHVSADIIMDPHKSGSEEFWTLDVRAMTSERCRRAVCVPRIRRHIK